VNTNDIFGGAARSAYRLHRELLKNEIDSSMFVQSKLSDDYTVKQRNTKYQKIMAKLRPHFDAMPKMVYRNKRSIPWSVNWLPNFNIKHLNLMQADILHLHWICAGFIPILALKDICAPIVWTLHDSWAFTGGCHIPHDCFHYHESCGKCPQLGSRYYLDLSNIIWKQKQYVYKKKDILIVTPSNWLAKCAKSSTLLSDKQIEVIPNGIDCNIYKPIDKKNARNILGINQNEKIILFGAINSINDSNKGFQFLHSALKMMYRIYDNKNIRIIIFGASSPEVKVDFYYPVQYIGHLHDDFSLALLYSAADVFVCPSKMESFSNTVAESLSCGLPSIAFNISGTVELIEHLQNGYLAKAYEPIDLANGIMWILEDERRWQFLSKNARNKMLNNYDISIIAKKHIDLYQKIINKK